MGSARSHLTKSSHVNWRRPPAALRGNPIPVLLRRPKPALAEKTQRHAAYTHTFLNEFRRCAASIALPSPGPPHPLSPVPLTLVLSDSTFSLFFCEMCGRLVLSHQLVIFYLTLTCSFGGVINVNTPFLQFFSLLLIVTLLCKTEAYRGTHTR